MREQPLRTLLRLRRIAMDEARLMLAACLDHEAATAKRMRAIEQAIREETDRASSLDGSDATVETFALWLRKAHTERNATSDELRQAETRTHEARVVLGASRQAVEAVETERQRRAEAERVAEHKQEQRVLDEIAARTP